MKYLNSKAVWFKPCLNHKKIVPRSGPWQDLVMDFLGAVLAREQILVAVVIVVVDY